MFVVFGDRFGLYVHSRVAMSRITENETGTRSGTGGTEAYSVEGITRTGFAAYVGPGLLIRLTSHVNLDLGVSAGYVRWGEPDTGLGPGQDLRTEFIPDDGPDLEGAIGFWVGLVIGIG